MADLSKFKLNQIVVQGRFEQPIKLDGDAWIVVEDPTEMFAIEEQILKDAHGRSCPRYSPISDNKTFAHVPNRCRIVSESGKCWQVGSKLNLIKLNWRSTFKMLIGLREINLWSTEEEYGAHWELIALQVDNQQWDELLTPPPQYQNVI